MNDIMFFLMLFFLIVSTMVNPNVIKLLLPNAKSSKQVMKQPITVSINAGGEYFVNKKPVTAATLEPELRALVPANAPADAQPTGSAARRCRPERAEASGRTRNRQPPEDENGNGHAVAAGGGQVGVLSLTN